MSDTDVRKTRWANGQNAEAREYEVDRQTLESPSSVVWWIDCPWCGREVKAYLWSLSGGGKRCECGALFGASGVAWKRWAAGTERQ